MKHLLRPSVDGVLHGSNCETEFTSSRLFKFGQESLMNNFIHFQVARRATNIIKTVWSHVHKWIFDSIGLNLQICNIFSCKFGKINIYTTPTLMSFTGVTSTHRPSTQPTIKQIFIMPTVDINRK